MAPWKKEQKHIQGSRDWKKLIDMLWMASSTCGRRGGWWYRIGQMVKELVHLPGIYSPLNGKVIWSDVKLNPLNSKVEDILKISAQLRHSCSPGKG